MSDISPTQEYSEASMKVPVQRTDGTKDEALVFLDQHRTEAALNLSQDPVYTRKLRGKVDLYVMTFLTLVYLLNYVDKVLLNYANVMNLSPSLHLTGNDFSNAGSAFWIAVLLGSFLSSYPLQRFPTAKFLALIVIGWGISTACHAATRNYAGLVAVRVLSGLFESGVPPAIMLLSAQYYTRKEQATRFAFWYVGMGFGQIIGGFLSWAFQHVSPHAPLSGWRIMFLVLGIVSSVIGILIWLFVPDTPMQARFLNVQEKVILLEHVKVNQTGIENKRWQMSQIREALFDFQYWAFFAAILLQGTGGGAITTYSATLIKSFGFSSERAALLNMPSGVFNGISCLFCGYGARYFGLRWPFAFAAACIGIIGASLMSFLPANSHGGLLAGIYLANFMVGTTPICLQWITANTAGHSKRAFVAASTNAAFAIGNIIGPQTFKAQDAPAYHPAKVTLICTWSVSAGIFVILAGYYYLVNKRRNGVVEKGEDIDDGEAYAGLTDKQNRGFRYVY